MFTVILVIYHIGISLTRLFRPVKPNLSHLLKIPRIKFGIILNQNATSFPQPRVSISLVISPSFSYKVSISVGAIAAGILWIYKSVYHSN